MNLTKQEIKQEIKRRINRNLELAEIYEKDGAFESGRQKRIVAQELSLLLDWIKR